MALYILAVTSIACIAMSIYLFSLVTELNEKTTLNYNYLLDNERYILELRRRLINLENKFEQKKNITLD